MPAFFSRAKQLIDKTLQPDEEVEIGAEEAAVAPNGELAPTHLPALRLLRERLPTPLPAVDCPTVYVDEKGCRMSYRGFLQSHPRLSTGELRLSPSASDPRRRSGAKNMGWQKKCGPLGPARTTTAPYSPRGAVHFSAT